MFGVIACAAALAGSLCAGGCGVVEHLRGTGIAVEAAPGGGATAVVRGDWDDVYPSVLVSTDSIEAAVLSRASPREGVLVVRFLTIRDREGTLTAERVSPVAEGVEPIRLTARIGAFGDEPRERRLVRAVGARLSELAGRATAPVGD